MRNGIISIWSVRQLHGTKIYLAASWARGTDPAAAEAQLEVAEVELRRRGAQVSSWWDILAGHPTDWRAALEADAAALASADWVIVVGDGNNEAPWVVAEATEVPVTHFDYLVLCDASG